MEKDLSETEAKAWRAFLYAYARVVPKLDDELTLAEGLTLNQYEVLLWLSRSSGGAMRMSDLASRIVLSPSGVTRAVDQLEKKGLVERVVCSSDRRGYLATLTKKGRVAFRKASKVHVRGIREHFISHLSASELKSLGSSLEQIA
ncbi:MAG TPA: MarR family transcriptional regulator [Actinomycetota bacterium]|nr:MarR family transcriptional regulator [Actinomycetota bacterium]